MSDSISRAMLRLDAMKAKAATRPEAAFTGTSSYGTDSSARPNVNRELFRHFVGWVSACLRVIANRVSSRPVCVGRRVVRADSSSPNGAKDAKGTREAPRASLPARLLKSPGVEGVELYERHPLLTALDKPNEFMDGSTLIQQTVYALQVTGEAYWWVVPGDDDARDDGEVEVWYMPPSWVTPVHDPESGTLYASYLVRPRNTGEEWEVPGSQMMRVCYPDPDNPVQGVLSPLITQLRAVLTDEDLQLAQQQFFKRGIFPGVALIAGRLPEVSGQEGLKGDRITLTKEQRNTLLLAIKQQYQGVVNYGEPLILDGLITDMKKLSTSAAEMDFGESGKLTKSRICQAFGVNPISMGEIEGVNRASAAIADQHLVSNTVNPIVSHLSHAITAYFASYYQEPDLVAYLEAAKANDEETTRLNVETAAKFGLISVDEGRTALGWEKLPGKAGNALIKPPAARRPGKPPQGAADAA